MNSSSSNSSGQPKMVSGDGGSMDEMKRKRMASNRESARRSRLRKQRHLDGLMAQVAELRNGNQRILDCLAVTSQNFARVESENAVLRAQMAELSHRLSSLEEIAGFVDQAEPAAGYGMAEPGFGNGCWNCSSQTVVMAASADHGFLY